MLICVVDDDPVFQFLAKKQFERCADDIEVLTFDNGLDAYHYFLSLDREVSAIPHISLVDINMPLMNGWELVEKLEKIDAVRKMHTYIVSSSVANDDKERSEANANVRRFLIKPLNYQLFEKLYMDALQVNPN